MTDPETTYVRAGGEVVDGETGELLPAPTAPLNLVGATSPAQFVERTTEYANTLAEVIRAKKLYKTIGQSNHVFVRAWTMLGSMLGVSPVLEEIERVEYDGASGWKATVAARLRSGEIIGRGTSLCLRSEKHWANRDEYALCSMAQTRATGRALKQPLEFIVTLAGFSTTPAEEIPSSGSVGLTPRGSQPASEKKATEAQHRKHRALLAELDKQFPNEAPYSERSTNYIRHEFGVESHAELTRAQMSQTIEHFQRESVPI